MTVSVVVTLKQSSKFNYFPDDFTSYDNKNKQHLRHLANESK